MNNLLKNLLIAVGVILLAACLSPQTREPEPEPTVGEFAEMRPENRNLDELTVALSRYDIELDFRKSYSATEAQIFTGIYEGLFSYHPITLEPVPALAERWELSDDRLQWTFIIRRNARFSNGDPLRAENFRSSWLSLLDPSRDSPYSSFLDIIEGARDFRTGTDNDPGKVGIIAADARTLIVKLNSPASFFPAMLCHYSFSPIHSSMIDRTDWSPSASSRNWTPPVSNGPFRLVSMNEESIVMQKCDQYWDRSQVALNKITLKFTSTPEEAAHLWNSGEARWISGDVDLEALTDRSGIQINVMFATHYYFIRSSERPWNDHRVRRAMALVLPWDELRGFYFLPAETLIFPIVGYPRARGITEANLEEALSLMAEAGFARVDGTAILNIPELVLRITPSRDAQRVATIMSTAWRDLLGFNVRVEVISFDRYYNSIREDGYTVGSMTWIGDFADPIAFLKMWQSESTLNDARLNDSDFDTLLARSMIEDGETRLATLSEAERLLLERGSVLPLSYSPALNIIDTGEIDGWYPNAMDIHPFRYLAFKALRPLPGVAFAHD